MSRAEHASREQGTGAVLVSGASADNLHLVATVAKSTAGLWIVPILDRVAEDRDVEPQLASAARALAPRFGATSLFYLSTARVTASGGRVLTEYDRSFILVI
jgi:hypothetical protein